MDVQRAGVRCGDGPRPSALHFLMTVVSPSSVALPHPARLAERLKCASQMFGAYTCRRNSL